MFFSKLFFWGYFKNEISAVKLQIKRLKAFTTQSKWDQLHKIIQMTYGLLYKRVNLIC